MSSAARYLSTVLRRSALVVSFLFGICFLALSVHRASADESFSCGKAVVVFSFEKFQHDGRQDFETVISVSRGERAVVLRYTNIDYVGGTCAMISDNEPMVVFQAYCGGSVCYDLDNWGIVDPADLLVRLVPNDWNREDAQKILGRALPEIEKLISVEREANKVGYEFP